MGEVQEELLDLETGGDNVDTEQELLQLMKRMGVKKQNVLLNKVVFLDMSQDAGEPVNLRK